MAAFLARICKRTVSPASPPPPSSYNYKTNKSVLLRLSARTAFVLLPARGFLNLNAAAQQQQCDVETGSYRAKGQEEEQVFVPPPHDDTLRDTHLPEPDSHDGNNMNMLQRISSLGSGGSSPSSSSPSHQPPVKGGCSLTEAYNFVRAHYTDSAQVVPRFQDSESNLSQASLNRRMLQMLELKPEHSIADLGSGCGITGNTFAYFGCRVVHGFEFHKQSTEISSAFAARLGLGLSTSLPPGEEEVNPGGGTELRWFAGAVNDHLTDQMKYDRLHGGYMMNAKNAEKYATENLKPGGIAVLNVGGDLYTGDVYVFRKPPDSDKVTVEPSGIGVIFQPDAKP